MSTRSFWELQQLLLAPLLAWGIGSVAVGAGLATARSTVVRHIGFQAVAWGGIDAALAWNGRRAARQNAQTSLGQQRDPAAMKAAQQLRTILAVNVGLDVLYIAGGAWLRRQPRPDRQGMGIGIIVQGAFLLIYDAVLTWLVQRWITE